MFSNSMREIKRFWTEWQQGFPIFNTTLIYSLQIFVCCCSHVYELCHDLEGFLTYGCTYYDVFLQSGYET
jgi:hypothetical protein